jgi:hypothetical protein
MAQAQFEDVNLEAVIAVDDEADQDRQVEAVLVSEPNLPEHPASPVSAILFILLIVVESSFQPPPPQTSRCS